MRTFFLSLFISSFLVSDIFAQQTVADFLLTAYEDVTLNQFDSQMNFITPRNIRIPVIDEVEIRMSNDERTYEDLRYQLRLRPANPWAIRRNNALFNARKEELSAEKQLQYKENLINRYELVLEYFEQLELSSLNRTRLELLSKKSSIFMENPSSDLFDAREFAKSKIEEVEVLEELNNIQVGSNNTQMEISIWMGETEIDWKYFPLISVSSVDSIAALITSNEFTSTELEYLTRRFETAQQETRVEKSDFDIGYVQAEYAPFIDPDKTSLGFSIGLNIPIFKNNKPQIAERMLDQIRRENILIAETKIDSIEKALEYGFLLNLTEQHFQLQRDIDNLDFDNLLSNLGRSENYDPIAMLELEEAALMLDEMVIKSKYRVLEQYLDFLYTYDSIVQKPLLNYLAKDLSPLE